MMMNGFYDTLQKFKRCQVSLKRRKTQPAVNFPLPLPPPQHTLLKPPPQRRQQNQNKIQSNTMERCKP